MLNYDHIHDIASQAGFSLCGIAPARILEEQKPRLDEWFARGYDSGLEYMGRYADKRIDPSALVDGAKTVVVCAVNYKNEMWNQQTEKRNPKIASYACAPDYHNTIKKMLTDMLRMIVEVNSGVGGRCFVDTAPILEKAWAVEAGLGWIGKNSLLVTRSFGTFVILGELVLDAECDRYDTPFEGDGCGSCSACMDACPNGAIRSPRVIDTSVCIPRLTTERMPEGIEPDTSKLHGWVFGCDACQSCCPYNRNTPLFSNPSFTPVVDPLGADADFWNRLTPDEFTRKFGKTPLKRAGYEKIISFVKSRT